MNPSANSLEQRESPSWESESWDHPVADTVCFGVLDSRHFQTSRLNWNCENPMLLTPHSRTCSDDQESAEIKPNIAADVIGPSLRQFNGLLPTSFPLNLSHTTWVTGIRDAGETALGASQTFQASLAPFHHTALGTTANCALSTGNTSYAEPRSTFEHHRHLSRLVNMDQKRMHDIMKHEIFRSPDFTTRIGLNLGGRTYFSAEDHNTLARFGKRYRPNSPGAQVPLCQAEGCKADLTIAKHYHRRHKVCEFHSKAANVIIGGQTQRFCQQCSRFHVLTEFDEGKRSCRKRLADHNRRRRKPQPNSASITANSTAELPTAKSDKQQQNANNNCSSPGSQTEVVASSKGYPLLSAMSVVPSASILLQNEKKKLPSICRNDDWEPYKHYVQGGTTVSGLSLSTLGSGFPSITTQRNSSAQNLSRVDITVPWLRPVGSINGAPDSSSPSRQFIECPARRSTMHDLSYTIQNVTSLQPNSKDHISNSDWIVKRITEQENGRLGEFGCKNLNLLQGNLDNPEVLGLLQQGVRETKASCNENPQDRDPTNLQFMQQQQLQSTTSISHVLDGHSPTGNNHGIKFQGVMGLRDEEQPELLDISRFLNWYRRERCF